VTRESNAGKISNTLHYSLFEIPVGYGQLCRTLEVAIARAL
jgi:hypothetical protein